MSTHPPRRRRIAGEPRPAAPGRPAAPRTVPTPPVRKPAAPAPAPEIEPEAAPAVLAKPAVPRPPKRTPKPVSDEPRPPSRFPVLLALVAIAALVGGGWLAWQGIDDVRGGESPAAVVEATDAAAIATETIFSYRYDQLDKHRQDSTALLTRDYTEKFDEIAPALDSAAPQRKVVAEAVVRDAAPVSCGDSCSADEVTVLVFFDQGRRVDDEAEPDVFGKRITVKMVLSDGRWLVDDIRAL